MKESYTALIKQIDGWWVGWIEELSGVNFEVGTARITSSCFARSPRIQP